jgi:hypothetical protein
VGLSDCDSMKHDGWQADQAARLAAWRSRRRPAGVSILWLPVAIGAWGTVVVLALGLAAS